MSVWDGFGERIKRWMANRPPPKPYTDPQPLVYLSKEQREEAGAWEQKHDAEKHIPPGKTYRYAGAIGGCYTWHVTHTSIGTIITYVCSCGEKLDVTDYDDW